MSKTYFDKNEKYTKEAFDLEDKVIKVIEKVFKEAVSEGYSIRETEYILQKLIEVVALNEILSYKAPDLEV